MIQNLYRPKHFLCIYLFFVQESIKNKLLEHTSWYTLTFTHKRDHPNDQSILTSLNRWITIQMSWKLDPKWSDLVTINRSRALASVSWSRDTLNWWWIHLTTAWKFSCPPASPPFWKLDYTRCAAHGESKTKYCG